MYKGDGRVFRNCWAEAFECIVGERNVVCGCDHVQSAGCGGKLNGGKEAGTSAHEGKREGSIWKQGMYVDL